MSLEIYQNELIRFGVFMYFLSLLIGAVLEKFKNPRMALSTHQTGLMIGTFSIAMAGVSSHIVLSSLLGKIFIYLHFIGNTILIVTLTLASHWGTRSLTPIAGGKEYAPKQQENIVKIGLQLSSTMIGISILCILIGFFL